MAEVTIYTGFACSFCERAKLLLTQKGLAFEEVNVALKPEQRDAMISRANGARTVPQVFINDVHVGGCDELYDLEKSGKLDDIINQPAD